MFKGHVVKIYKALGRGWLINIIWEYAIACPESASYHVWVQQLLSAILNLTSPSSPVCLSSEWTFV